MPSIRRADVVAAMESKGSWSRTHEWRISTVTTTEIVRTEEAKRYRAYLVRVECDFVFEAHTPTITRAVELATRYELLAQQLWAELGWPSWASQRELEPAPDAV